MSQLTNSFCSESRANSQEKTTHAQGLVFVIDNTAGCRIWGGLHTKYWYDHSL